VITRIRHLIHSILRWRNKSTNRETALVVLVPSAEEHIVDLRRGLSSDGMPAHITVLYPFIRRSSITSDDVSLLRRTLGEVEPFTFELSEVGWFEERVLYLVPNPTAPFKEMTQLMAGAFPRYKPYGGEFQEIVPHLTVAEGASVSKLREAARAITELLPIHAEVNVVCLMARDVSGNWEIHTKFDLAR
jgi:2'-5' RNA ligase